MSQLPALHIQWDGPFSVNEAMQLDDWASDYGVYQVYGAHPLYGRNALIYLGCAEGRPFGIRIKEHETWLKSNPDADQVQIYVGRLHTFHSTPNDEEWRRQIRAAEALLIYAHGPAANSSGLNIEMGHDFYDVHVLNWGKFAELLPEVSGARYSNKYWTRNGYTRYVSPGPSAP